MNCTPKNVRQIGDVDPAHKIYVEDYVITFARSLGDTWESTDLQCKAAVLLGRKNASGTDVETYISGAVLIENIKLSGEASFTNEIWSGIYDKIKEYYDDEDIVGWLYIGNGPQIQLDARLVNIHGSNFSGKNMVFMAYDCDEKEEIFFDYIDSQFIQRKGFYIYYQKNDAMHNYMLLSSSIKVESCESEDHVVKDIRSILGKRQIERQHTKRTHSIYAAGMLVAAVALLIGTTVIYRYNDPGDHETSVDMAESDEDKLKTDVMQLGTALPQTDGTQSVTALPQIDGTQSVASLPQIDGTQSEASLPQLDGTQSESVLPQPDGTQPEAASPQPDGTQQEAASPQPDGTQSEADLSQNDDTEQDGSQQSDSNKSNDSQPVASINQPYSFYIVKTGDNLGNIAESIYNSIGYVKKIMDINKINDPDKIYEGQKLWLPEP